MLHYLTKEIRFRGKIPPPRSHLRHFRHLGQHPPAPPRDLLPPLCVQHQRRRSAPSSASRPHVPPEPRSAPPRRFPTSLALAGAHQALRIAPLFDL